MILDKLENINRYKGILNTEAIMKTIQEKIYESVESGKFSIEGETDFFGIHLKYDTRDASECLWEAHEQYLDIHFIVGGEEVLSVNDISNMKVTQDYDKENDYTLFEGEQFQNIVLKKGDFLALYPNEVHKTAIKAEAVSAIQKIVFKQEL